MKSVHWMKARVGGAEMILFTLANSYQLTAEFPPSILLMRTYVGLVVRQGMNHVLNISYSLSCFIGNQVLYFLNYCVLTVVIHFISNYSPLE